MRIRKRTLFLACTAIIFISLGVFGLSELYKSRLSEENQSLFCKAVTQELIARGHDCYCLRSIFEPTNKQLKNTTQSMCTCECKLANGTIVKIGVLSSDIGNNTTALPALNSS